MTLSLIVAHTHDGLIGNQGALPWRLSADLRRFKRITMGHHLVMGRKTYASIGRPLPGRTSIVLTRNSAWTAPGVLVATDIPEAIRLAGDDPEIFVIGGAQIYAAALPFVDRVYLTRVHASLAGDTYLPDPGWRDWQVTEEQSHAADEKNDYDVTFQILCRHDGSESSAS